MKNRAVLLALPLSLLAACGQATVPQTQAPTAPSPVQAETPATPDLKTFAALLQKPGWQQTSPGSWERTTEDGRETLYAGAAGAERALQDRKTTLDRVTKDLAGRPGSAPILQKLQHSVDTLQRNLDTAREKGALTSQSVWQCTVQASTQVTTEARGVKATGYVSCPSSAYSLSGQAVAPAPIRVAGTRRVAGRT